MAKPPEFSDRPASIEEYLTLREDAGMGGYKFEAAQRGLANGLHGVWLRDETGRLIAMGRLVGDGGCFAQVTDIVVNPEFQRRGYGKRIMTALMDWAEGNLAEGCYVSLIADPGAEALYEAFGFEYRTGMARRMS